MHHIGRGGSNRPGLIVRTFVADSMQYPPAATYSVTGTPDYFHVVQLRNVRLEPCEYLCDGHIPFGTARVEFNTPMRTNWSQQGSVTPRSTDYLQNAKILRLKGASVGDQRIELEVVVDCPA